MRLLALALSLGLHALAVVLAPTGAAAKLPSQAALVWEVTTLAPAPPPPPPPAPPVRVKSAPGVKRSGAPKQPPAAALPDQGGALPVPEGPPPFVFKAKFSEEQKVEQPQQEPQQGAAPVELAAALEHEVKPPYPDEARNAEVDGEVLLRVTIGADGRVEAVEVLSSPGFGLDVAARRALLQARFRPATRDGVPVRSTLKYRYVFRLD